ncbi:helix-turn-helix domain-containing protein [Pseudomonas viridiflava]|uniref:helix-turn-helix domain-containing protein n=1 Tax=Pseudomonas viridiflava TaxID=33069 RepID=UPI002EC9987E|nr:helix-turn-helix domain-containing protein [Pseudomonas viridiflava]
MSQERRIFFKDLAPAPESPLGVDPAISSVIATYLGEAIINKNRSSLADISDDIVALFQESVKAAPDDVVDAALDEDVFNDLRSAFILGQFSFAQLISGVLLSRTADESSKDALLDLVTRKYLCSLYHADSTNTELAEITEYRVETVSRHLRKLRELGLVDYRREGVNVLNFLTPYARTMLEKNMPESGVEKVTRQVKEKLNDASKAVPLVMKEFLGFGRTGS